MPHDPDSRLSARKQVRKPAAVQPARFDLFEHAPAGYCLLDENGMVLAANRALSALLDLPAEALAHEPLARFVFPEDQTVYARFRRGLVDTGSPQSCELRLEQKDGTLVWAHLAGTTTPDGRDTSASRVIVCDLTDYKKSELFLQSLHVVVAQVNQAIVHFRKRDELFREVCRIAVRYGHFPLVWIGLADAATRQIRPTAHAGRDDAFLKAIHVNVNPASAFSQGPIGQAFLLNQVLASKEADASFQRSPWRVEMLKRGFRSLVAIPFRLNGSPVGTLNLYADASYDFSDVELDVLKRLGNALSFALDCFEIEKSREQAEAALRESEARNRAFIRAIPDLVFLNSRDGEYLSVHAPDPALLAAPPDTILHRHIQEMLPADLADRCLAAIRAALDSRTLQKVAYELPLDGQTRRFEARIAPCTLDTALTIVRDVTDLEAPAPKTHRRRKTLG